MGHVHHTMQAMFALILCSMPATALHAECQAWLAHLLYSDCTQLFSAGAWLGRLGRCFGLLRLLRWLPTLAALLLLLLLGRGRVCLGLCGWRPAQDDAHVDTRAACLRLAGIGPAAMRRREGRSVPAARGHATHADVEHRGGRHTRRDAKPPVARWPCLRCCICMLNSSGASLHYQQRCGG